MLVRAPPQTLKQRDGEIASLLQQVRDLEASRAALAGL
jgi:hypothetical protein